MHKCEALNEEPYAGNPQVRFREGSVFNPIMEQILWHSQRKRRETVKTNLLLKLERHTSTRHFPLSTTMAHPSETSTEQFGKMIDSSTFEGLIVLTDGGITCSEIISKALSKGYTVIGRMRTNITVVVDDAEVLLSDLNKNTKSVSSVIAWVPAYSRKVKLVFDNEIDTRVIMSTDISMDEHVILSHYSKREDIEDYFNYVKNELGLGAPVYLAKNMLMHAEAVQICFTAWMVSQFWLNFKDQIGLREFVEEMRTLYYLALFKLGLIPLDMDWHVYEFLKPKCIV